VKTWHWTRVWCGVCNEVPVVLGRRWIQHTDERPSCILCQVHRACLELKEVLGI
jgi:hypothetical protein